MVLFLSCYISLLVVVVVFNLVYWELTFIKRNFITLETQGWDSDDPGTSCKDIRDSGSSKGDGQYWINPGWSGDPLKVYCDMTTDGGED